MLSPRWRKVLRDLWGSKLRTFLVALSIAIGVFAVGVVTQTFTTVQRQLVVEYPKSNPASATLITDPFDDELLYSIRRMEGIEYAEGRAISVVKVRIGADQWQRMLLFAIPDFNHIEIDKVFPQPTFPPNPKIGAERGVWPPPEHGVLIERASFLIPTLLPAGTRVGFSFSSSCLSPAQSARTSDVKFQLARLAMISPVLLPLSAASRSIMAAMS